MHHFRLVLFPTLTLRDLLPAAPEMRTMQRTPSVGESLPRACYANGIAPDSNRDDPQGVAVKAGHSLRPWSRLYSLVLRVCLPSGLLLPLRSRRHRVPHQATPLPPYYSHDDDEDARRLESWWQGADKRSQQIYSLPEKAARKAARCSGAVDMRWQQEPRMGGKNEGSKRTVGYLSLRRLFLVAEPLVPSRLVAVAWPLWSARSL